MVMNGLMGFGSKYKDEVVDQKLNLDNNDHDNKSEDLCCYQ